MSAGIKGLRIGTGPPGNYVQMGRGGIYFRQTIPSSDSRGTPSLVPQEQSSIDFKEIESGSVSQMVDSSSAALLDEINSKSRKMLIWPWVLAVSICLLIALAAASLPGWIYFLLVALIRLHFRAGRSCRRCASDASYESVGNAGSIDVTTSDIPLVTDSV